MTKISSKRINICCKCAREYYKCSHWKCRYICTSENNWYILKKKYRYKIFGRYRMKRYIQKQIKHLKIKKF